MSTRQNAQEIQNLLIENQPELAIGGSIPNDAVVSWERTTVGVRVLSRFESDVWIGAKLGSLHATTESSRRIDFRTLPEDFRCAAKLILYASLRYPYRINKPPSFATLIKKWQAIERYLKHLISKGIFSFEDTSIQINTEFLSEIARVSLHVETLVGQVALLREINVHHQQGKLNFSVPLPSYARGSGVVARKIWQDVHHVKFDDGKGYQPLEDIDAEIVVRSALFYLDTLSIPIIQSFRDCCEVAANYPNRRFNRSEEGLCFRAQREKLNRIQWPAADCEYTNWPPKNFRQVRTHVRLLSAACAIVVFFALGCRRTELVGLKKDCLQGIGQDCSIRITYRKGEDDLQSGREVLLPASAELVKAVEIQKSISRLLAQNIHGFSEGDKDHDFLFSLIRDRYFYDPDDHEKVRDASDYRSRVAVVQHYPGAEGEDNLTGREGGPMTLVALNAMLRDYKLFVTPDVVGSIAPHRFRKTIGRLIALSMEGAPLILQLIYGHDNYQVTLRYMFASPFIQDEIVEQYPELISRNLAQIYKSRDELGGAGGQIVIQALKAFQSKRSPIQTAPELDLTEEEFVAIGLEMVESGYMMLSVLAKGMYCFKPVDTVGQCGKSDGDVFPNISRCTSICLYNIQTSDRKARVQRTIDWLVHKMSLPSLSDSMRKFYGRQLDAHRLAFKE